jgi:hypothetical protein
MRSHIPIQTPKILGNHEISIIKLKFHHSEARISDTIIIGK